MVDDRQGKKWLFATSVAKKNMALAGHPRPCKTRLYGWDSDAVWNTVTSPDEATSMNSRLYPTNTSKVRWIWNSTSELSDVAFLKSIR